MLFGKRTGVCGNTTGETGCISPQGNITTSGSNPGGGASGGGSTGTETGTNGGPGAKDAGAIDGTPGGAGGAGGGGGTPGSKLSPISLLLPILVSNCEHSIGATGGTVALGEGNKFKGGLGGDFGG